MEIIKQTDTELIFKAKNSKTGRYVVVLINIFLVTIYIMRFGTEALIWTLLVIFIFDLLYWFGSAKTMTVVIDKAKDEFWINANNTLVYEADYSLKEIRSIKTVISPKIMSGSATSLVAVLKNNEEKVIENKSHHDVATPMPFAIAIHANRQAEMGQKIA
jgi:hypothetical protein